MKRKTQRTTTTISAYKGPLSSNHENEFKTTVSSDLQELFSRLVVLEQANKHLQIALSTETVDAEENKTLKAMLRTFLRGVEDKQTDSLAFHNANRISFDSTMSASRACIVDTNYGIVTLPINNLLHLTHNLDIQGNRAGLTSNIAYTTVWGGVDYAYDGDVILVKDLANMLNGINEDETKIDIVHELNSDIHEVKVKLNITLASVGNNLMNVIYFALSGVRGQTIESVGITTDLTSDTYTTILENELLDYSTKFAMEQKRVAKLQIILTQKNFIEYEDKKVFSFGLRELGIAYQDYDKTTFDDADNVNHFIFSSTATDNKHFIGIDDIVCTPNIFSEVSYADRSIRIKAYKNTIEAGNLVLDTGTTNTLTTTWTDTDITVIYFVVMMRYNVNPTTGSPFDTGSTPYLNDLTVLLSTEND